jgi:formylglycine-generating enzyme
VAEPKRIFICYRKDDAAWVALNLGDRLERVWPEQVFVDADHIVAGSTYDEVIMSALRSSAVVVAVIGPKWDEQLQERLTQRGTRDWVREELTEALALKLPIIPVLVDGARLTPVDRLPAPLQRLHGFHWVKLSSDARRHGMEELVDAIRQHLLPPPATTTATSAPLAGPPPSAPAASPGRPPKPPQRPPWITAEGTDTHGRWAEFSVDRVVQRLRWIAPGSFEMGSEAGFLGLFGGEAKRGGDETRHRVTLSRGFWMADTACTQGLWQAVTGQNPSHFKGDLTLPVERVS